MWKVKVITLFLLSTIFAGAIATATETITTATENVAFSGDTDDDVNDAQLLVDWLVNEKHGYISNVIEIRRIEKTSYQEDYALFATQDISKDETLLTIPVESMVSGKTTTSNTQKQHEHDDEHEFDDVDCRTVQNMVLEYLTGPASQYYPYMKYIFEGYGYQNGIQPITWSKQAQSILFDTFIKYELFPTREYASHFTYHEDCIGYHPKKYHDVNEDDADDADAVMNELLEVAYHYFVSRSRGDAIIPIFDMIQHRNGNWTNVDGKPVKTNTDSASVKRAVQVFATRDIRKGEQLYTSMNECQYFGCDGMDDVFVTQHFFSHMGFIEEYPRRWLFECDLSEPGSEMDLLFDLDLISNSNGKKEFVLHWRDSKLNLFKINWIRAHLDRLHILNETISTQVALLKSPHERDMILQYYEAYTEALEVAWAHRKADTHPTNKDDNNETEQQVYYDPLIESKSTYLDWRENFHVCTVSPRVDEDDRFQLALLESHYQKIRYSINKDQDDTCLALGGWMQVCTSFRAQYHEALVHVPAQYAPEVKRVIYLGGGDNMILHEIMKYPDLELVVGLELDQMVPRSSFRSFGTSPFFHDPRINWWFGDASKGLLVLPQEYYGSFDLVIVDLLTYIADTIMVTGTLSIMDAAALLMKPEGGVISRNEDFSTRTNIGFAKYTVDLEYHDIDFVCEHSVTMGSDSIDFVKAKPNDHGIDTIAEPLHFPESLEKFGAEPFHEWFEYRQTESSTCEKQAGTPNENEILNKASPGARHGQYGAMAIIEAENATLSSEDPSKIESTIIDVTTQLGLSKIEVAKADINRNIFVLVLREGYIITRVFANQRYIAFDVLLWDYFDKLDAIMEELVVGVGGNPQESTTSFRIVTAGMPSEQNSCPVDFVSQIAAGAEKRRCEDMEISNQKDADAAISDQKQVLWGLMEFMLPHRPDKALVVLCGRKEEECLSLETALGLASLSTEVSVFAIYDCGLYDDMAGCESMIRENLLMIANANQKINGMILDKTMPYEMGQVIHRIFNDTKTYDNSLEKNHFVLSPVIPGESWREELVDRFRTDMAFFDPAHTAAFLFSKQHVHDKWCLFTSGRKDFLKIFTDSLSSIANMTSYDSYTILKVENGMKNLVADFSATAKVIRDDDYDRSKAAKQWLSQTPMGYQIVIQLAANALKATLDKNERVLAEVDPDGGPWDKLYGTATITGKVNDDTYLYISDIENDVTGTVGREFIRQMSPRDFDPTRTFKVGDIILLQYKEGLYRNGVVSAVTGVDEYSIYILDFFKTTFHNVKGRDLLLEAESEEYMEQSPKLELSTILALFEQTLSTAGVVDNKTWATMTRKSITIGSGAVEVFLWSHGNAILRWDGSTNVEINLFTYDEEDRTKQLYFQKLLARNFKHVMKIVLLDEFPRGYGKIVNFSNEMKEPPHWLAQYEMKAGVATS